MDIKEGHPGAIFSWFFDSNQATDQLAQFLIILYGSGPEMARLAESCLREQSAFNDALGPEILFLFFDPDVPIGTSFSKTVDVWRNN
jgi:hypothetical protein